VSSFEVVFTDRRGGFGTGPFASANLSEAVGDDRTAVSANRAALARRLRVDPARLVLMEQVHGAEVARVADAPPGRAGGPPAWVVVTAEGADAAAGHGSGTVAAAGRVPGVDGLVTTATELALVALAADCVPVVLVDPRAGVAGVAHAGRRGVAAGVVPSTVDAMIAAGAAASAVAAWLGPAACGACYEVPADVQDEVAAAVPESRCVTRAGSCGLDLRAGIAGQLRRAGVAPPHVDPRCTIEDATLFSHRRDHGRTGRHAGVVMLRSGRP
jgi:YfiH family protein